MGVTSLRMCVILSRKGSRTISLYVCFSIEYTFFFGSTYLSLILIFFSTFLLSRMINMVQQDKSVKFCLDAMRHTSVMGGLRMYPPSTPEMDAIAQQTDMTITIHLVDGSHVKQPINSFTTASNVSSAIVKTLNLPLLASSLPTFATKSATVLPQEYAIYEVSGGLERSIGGLERLADIVSKWENYQKAYAMMSSKIPAGGAGATESKHPLHYIFLLKRYLHMPQTEESSNILQNPTSLPISFPIPLTSANVSSLYSQAVYNVASNSFYLSQENALTLAALRCSLEQNLPLSKCLPNHHILQKSSDLWYHLILRRRALFGLSSSLSNPSPSHPFNFASASSGSTLSTSSSTSSSAPLTPFSVRELYVRYFCASILYGHHIFAVRPASLSSSSSSPPPSSKEEIFISVNVYGFHFLSTSYPPRVRRSFSYSQIHSWEANKSLLEVTIQVAPQGPQRALRIETSQGGEIVGLMESYIFLLRGASYALAISSCGEEKNKLAGALLYKKGDLIQIVQKDGCASGCYIGKIVPHPASSSSSSLSSSSSPGTPPLPSSSTPTGLFYICNTVLCFGNVQQNPSQPVESGFLPPTLESCGVWADSAGGGGGSGVNLNLKMDATQESVVPFIPLPTARVDSITFQFSIFAQRYFTNGAQGRFFSRTPLPRPLMNVPARYSGITLEIYARLMRYMGDLPPSPTSALSSFISPTVWSSDPLVLIQEAIAVVLSVCMSIVLNPLDAVGGGGGGSMHQQQQQQSDMMTSSASCLIDQVFCYLIKQTSMNPSVTSTQKGWHLLCICCGCFAPSVTLMDYVVAYIQDHAILESEPISLFARYSLHKLRLTIENCIEFPSSTSAPSQPGAVAPTAASSSMTPAPPGSGSTSPPPPARLSKQITPSLI
eukprot:TRINITY_DN2599_c1_g1_i5.p1 TRINITY_DN2599_c1_g1~~TRINITY_DN2599_c1_g1_i5.p1  ORF type:complete len:891 (-),score=156.21 TRINITY_DN2599_c1_g1_i5:75-2747(-)